MSYWKLKNMPWQRNISLPNSKGFLERSKATDINFSIHKLLNKDQAVVNENANKDSDVFNTQRDLTAGIVGNQSVFKCFLSMWLMPTKKGISTITIWTIALALR